MITAHSPKWGNAEHTEITLYVAFPWLISEVQFTARGNDSEAHGRALFARASAGEFGPIAAYVAPDPTVPQSVSALQGLLAIDSYGLASAYEAWANDPARTFAQKAFISKAQTWKRADPTLGAAAAHLGLTSDQVDAMFSLAATL